MYAPAGNLLDERRESFSRRVNGVCSHGVTAIVEQVNHEHRAQRRGGEHPDLQVTGTPSEGHHDRIGLVVFAAQAVTQCPLTLDYPVLTNLIDDVDMGMLEDGTAIGVALATAANRLKKSEAKSRVVVLLTDGENTEGPEPLELAQVAAEAGVRIYPVGIGSPEGAVIQIDGFNIVTQLNETSLQEIANLTNGEYFHAADADALQEIYDTIDLQLTVEGETTEITSVLAGIGALFFLFGGVLSMIWFGRLP